LVRKIKDYINKLEVEFKNNANPKIAFGQKAYLKNKFEFYGIKTGTRRKIQEPFFNNNYLPSKDNLEKIVKTLWLKPEREYQYFTQELVFKYIKKFKKNDIKLFEFMLINKSWWDTIDFITPKLIGEYFKLYPEFKTKYSKKWIASNNIWLQRSSLIFQLKYKNKLDTKTLKNNINSLLNSNEFFVNKAIGWILREYGKTNPKWVIKFVRKTELSNLSKKQALKHLDF